MSFDRARAENGWLNQSPITPQELEGFDRDRERSIDGHAGGAYAPSSAIIIGGAGVQFTTPLITADIEAGGDITVGGALDIVGGANFQDNVAFQDDVQFLNDKVITFEAAVNFAAGSDVHVYCQFYVHNSWLLADKFGSPNIADSGTGLIITSFVGVGAVFTGEVQFTGSGRVRQRLKRVTSSALENFSIADGTNFRITGITAAGGCNLLNAGAADGDEVFFWNETAHLYTIAPEDTGTSHAIQKLSGSSSLPGIRFVFDNGRWRSTGYTWDP